MELEWILRTIQSLPLKEALEFLFAQKIYDLGAKGYESIRRTIQQKNSEKKFGFVPNKDESNFLARVPEERKYFTEFAQVLPKHKYSDLIRVGYLIAHLNKIGGEANRTRVRDLRDSISHKPNGSVLIKIVSLVTTGAIVPVVEYLAELKRKNYDTDHLTDVFDEIILEWEQYTYFVRAETTVAQIVQHVKQKIQTKQKLVMVFSYGSAKGPTTQAIAQLLKEGTTEGYFYDSKNNTEGEKEVHSSTFSFID